MTRHAPPILLAGDPRLRAPTLAVGAGYPSLAADVALLEAALREARAREGFGRAIAAPQIGLSRRIVVADLGAGPFVLVDPELAWRSDETFDVWDDCFSVPDRLVRVRRHRSITLAFRDRALRPRTWARLPPDLAELFQHELDHLDGVLMLDRATGEDAVQPASRRAELVPPRAPHRLSLDAIASAARAIDPAFTGSPALACDPLSERLGCALTLKVETVNPIRSFKGRGADWFLARGERGPFVCASAGNFGQAMAYACRARGLACVVFAAEDANALKVARMCALGADVRLVPGDFEDAKRAARAFAGAEGARFVEDGLEPEIAEGAGSIAVELFAGSAAFDDVVVPLGDGALLGGMARWIKARAPWTRVVGVCSRGAPAMRDAWRAPAGARAAATPKPDTIADGIAVRVPIAEAVDDLRGLVDDVVAVSDDALVRSMRLVHADAGLVVEPAGAAGVAAILEDRAAFARRRVATVLTGGNVTHEQLHAWRVLDALPRDEEEGTVT